MSHFVESVMNWSEKICFSHSGHQRWPPNTTNSEGCFASAAPKVVPGWVLRTHTPGRVWSKLPTDIIHHILKYDGTMTYRNGKYMNKIPNPDENYPLILERMKIQRYRRFLSKMSFVTIQIPTGITEKEICFWATNKGLKITLFEWDYEDNSSIREKQLYSNR